VEQLLAGIWKDLFGIDKVGVHDNFFELGGDSVLNIQFTARANQSGLRLTPKQVFEHQTIAALGAIAGISASVSVAKPHSESDRASSTEFGSGVNESDLVEINRQFESVPGDTR
jgi:aryl carrier-like protein